MRRKLKDKGDVLMTIVMPQDVHKALMASVQSNGTTASNVVRDFVRTYIKKNEPQAVV